MATLSYSGFAVFTRHSCRLSSVHHLGLCVLCVCLQQPWCLVPGCAALISYNPLGDGEATSLLPPSVVWPLVQSSHPQLGCLSHSLLHCFRSGIF